MLGQDAYDIKRIRLTKEFRESLDALESEKLFTKKEMDEARRSFLDALDKADERNAKNWISSLICGAILGAVAMAMALLVFKH